ncbi:restriction endonuclease subunit S [Phocaeicola vulgatus]|nr:restriction endonuclease subunit S [Phocaeicola vulgatus]KAB3560154.1 restriction endonuclease subunit S [Phocaeicola vulgatus]KAB3580389.1 restriction endonuclease subunit S [Phocaeicola vulgatus]KAB3585604.1 restriction endonuclease subunit S [Phocaeicola vulgatus]KAB3585816.1 restriction endonuclease subunit S [Phocaeicola vulgatus]
MSDTLLVKQFVFINKCMVSAISLSSYYEKFLATGEVKCIDEEIPFEIPNGWQWERIGNIFETTSGSTPLSRNPDYYKNGNINWVRTTDLNNGILNKTEIQITSKAIIDYNLSILPQTSVCVAMYGGAGTIGKHCILHFDTTINQSVCAIQPNGFCNMDYIHTFIEYQRPFWMDFAAGSRKDPNINQLIIKHCLLPIPPQEEQLRIVTKLNQLYPYIYQYGNSQNRLNQINKEIWHSLKKSILQEAIQGKLVSQIAEEGTAQELLEQIRQEKLQLVKEGKLKKSALTDSIIFRGDDNKYYERINEQIVEVELPFEYPNSWIVLRLKDICQLTDGEKRNGKGICLDAKFLRGKSSATIIEKGRFVYAGDNIILVDGENSGEVFSIPQDGYMGSTFKQLWLSSVMWKPCILAFILFYKEALRNSKRGAAIPHLNKDLFYKLPIGIPPLSEQQRITCQINNLFQLIK